ncbi:MAG: glycoside hydrolase family 52 protein [Planctomycetota bacterium]
MSWQIARLGSRFGLLFEPYKQRVMHSALGRLLDRPMDLCVGLVEPDGTERVLPFTTQGEPFLNCEQFERFNSITYRGYSGKFGIRFELNIHSPFYPQDEKLCLLPVFYLEFRVHHVVHARWQEKMHQPEQQVNLFLRLKRPDTQITVGDNAIDLSYTNHLTFNPDRGSPYPETNLPPSDGPTIPVRERIVSLNEGCRPTADGDGLTLKMPVTMPDQGTKWRLIWCAHAPGTVMQVGRRGEAYDAAFRYTDHWPTLDDVVDQARQTRDDHLAHSRRLEKLVQQAPLNVAQSHLVAQSWQSYLANTFWMSHASPGVKDGSCPPGTRESWFSVLEGSRLYQSTLNAESNSAMFYLAMWPRLLKMQLTQWLERVGDHDESGGKIIVHDLGLGLNAIRAAYKHPSPAEQNADILGLMQCYAHWTGDSSLIRQHHELIVGLATYLKWTDRDHSGFPSVGLSTTHVSRYATMFRNSPKQTYIAIKRGVGLRAAADLLKHAGRADVAPAAKDFEREAELAAQHITELAWDGDHLLVCVDPALAADVGGPRVSDIYCIYNANAELLPMMIGQPPLIDGELLLKDILAGKRETARRYGNCNTTVETDHLRISQNLWRDMIGRYLRSAGPSSASHYWDMQVMANTHLQSKGFVDAYITDNLAHYPRGVTTLGYLLAGPQLMIDRLAPGSGGTYITIDPNRKNPARWPLLPLADWKGGKVPIAVVSPDGRVSIESEIDPVIIHGQEELSDAGMIG